MHASAAAALSQVQVEYAASAVGVTKLYGSGDASVRALDGVDVAFERARFTAIMGPSGSGKSTLMHLLAGLDTATSGRMYLGNTELTALKEKELTKLRRDKIGFVFQGYNLVPSLTARENIALPSMLAGRRRDDARLDELAAYLGIADRLDHRPSELSGGQQQRVAAARALASGPEVVFADEPTGALDSQSSAQLLGLLRHATRQMGQTIVMVTHDPVAASYSDRVVFLLDGRIVAELANPQPDTVLDEMKRLDRFAA